MLHQVYADASEGAAYGLLAVMKGISEECWATGWMADLELVCWQAATQPEPPRASRQGRLN